MIATGKVTARAGIGAAVAAAIALTVAFWWPLYWGGGFVGGDVYSYYLPQKVIYAEHLRHFELPLWNDRAGHGYPIVGESQTGPFYPFHLCLYSLCSINTAYSVNHLVHYVLAFVFAWLYARSVGLSGCASGLAALVYTYGWFPPRTCWEWAILGGAWLPAAFWCVERFFATRRLRFVMGLCVALTLQLLAGHFNLAFLTIVALVPYVMLRLFFGGREFAEESSARRLAWAAWPFAAVLCAFALSAVQLAPTWELKTHSQRETPGAHHQLAQGAIPVQYLAQLVRPWYWYSLATNRDEALHDWTEAGAPTNQVEAQLYFGFIPLVLALGAIVPAFRTRDRIGLIWIALGSAALIYTTGWLLGVTRYIPGFNFFQDPGRYGVITTLAVGILAGKSLDRLRSTGSLWLSLAVLLAFVAAMITGLILTAEAQATLEQYKTPSPFKIGPLVLNDGAMTYLLLAGGVVLIVAIAAPRFVAGSNRDQAAGFSRWSFTGCVFLATAIELLFISKVVRYSEMVGNPPILHLDESPIRRILSETGGTARVLAPAANLPTILGAAATPVYLTFGPAAYVDPKLTMPESPLSAKIDWLRRAGVTHILSFEPLNEEEWPVRPVWKGLDPFFSRALARYREPLFLYVLEGSRGRIAWAKAEPRQTAKIVEFGSNRIVADADSSAGGRLIFTDLMYPGWQVRVDDQPAEALTAEGMYRAVDLPAGRHRVVWSYHPRSLYWGTVVSALAMIFVAAVAHVRYRHPQLLKFLDPPRSR